MKKEKSHHIKLTGFKTPDHYFESFEDKLFERLTEKETIEGIAASGYSVPKDYFETFENSLIEKLHSDNDKPVIVLNPKRKFYYIAGIAASFVLFFSLVLNRENPITIGGIDTVAIENYLYQEDYSNDELASLFISNDISETDFIDVNINEDILNQYLETIDTEDFILD